MRLNTQPPEKRNHGLGTTLEVNSIFPTLQGEGPFSGTRAVFVRLAGCNLQCPLCDTEYTERSEREVNDILNTADDYLPPVRSYPRRLLVITGGEPFRQTLAPLVECAIERGWRVQIETNGTLYQELPWTSPHLTVVCSPKAGKVHHMLLPWIAAFKYVATADSIDPEDGLPVHALAHSVQGKLFRPPRAWKGEVYLQPVDIQDPEQNKKNQQAVVDSCLRFGHRLCLQTHKIVSLP